MPAIATKATYFAALAPQSVDVENGKVNGLCLMKAGPALGHGQGVDMTTLSQLVAECQKAGKISLVVKHDGHPFDVVGPLTNFRVEGDAARADLSVYTNFADRARFLEIANDDPSAFGTSAEFKNAPETIGNAKFARVTKVRRFALERDPAASPNGLFSEVQPNSDTLESMTSEELTAAITAGNKPLLDRVVALETKFSEQKAAPTAEELKKFAEDAGLDALIKFAAKVGIKEAPKNGNSGDLTVTEPDYLTKFKAHKAVAPSAGVAIARFANDNPNEYNAWHNAGRPGL